jgi:hypothetical protein
MRGLFGSVLLVALTALPQHVKKEDTALASVEAV